MVWTHYCLKFRLCSPMHIGYRKEGNLMLTRNYVPGKNLWAALTARLTRDCPNRRWAKGYKEVGKCVIEQLRLGYLWPSLDGKKPCFPWYKKDFDYLFLDSYASAALDYSAYSTEEGSLHETEYLAPIARNEKPVYLVGDLWAKDGQIEANDWQVSMKNLQLGGERTYGWGRLSHGTNWSRKSSGQGKTALDHEWREEGEEIILKLGQDDKVTAHVLASFDESRTGGSASGCSGVEIAALAKVSRKDVTKDIIGPVEPLVGREWKDYSGQNVCYTGVFFVPGCKVKRETKFAVDAFGRWMEPPSIPL